MLRVKPAYEPICTFGPGLRVDNAGKTDNGSSLLLSEFFSLRLLVLHTDANLIFAIASGMWKFALRLPPEVVSQAVADGTGEYSDIGSDWLLVDAFPRGVSKAAADAVHMRLCERAFRYAEEIAANA